MIRAAVYLSLLFLLGACSSFWPGRSPDTPRAFEGVVDEPVFKHQMYLKMRGNPRKPVVVLVHGLGDSASSVWDDAIRRLEKDYFLVVFDLPGFGNSSKTNQLYSPYNYSRLIRHLADDYIKKPFHLVGHSMGGAVSLRYAASYPEDVLSLTLVSAAGILHRLAYSKYLAALGLNPFSDYLNFKKNDVTAATGHVLNMLDSYMNVDMGLVLRSEFLRASVLLGKPSIIAALALVLEDYSGTAEKISAPTRLIWGQSDPVAPLRTGHVLHALIKHARLHVIADAGHVPMRDNPAEFHRILTQGLNTDIPPRPIRRTSAIQTSASCNHRRYVTYQGIIESLVIDHCADVYIQNARLKKLSVNNSRVYLENVEIISANVALDAQNSTVEITAGKIQGPTAIQTNNSRFDIAGTALVGGEKIIKASRSTTSRAVFSLTPVVNSRGQRTILHGRYDLSGEPDFFK